MKKLQDYILYFVGSILIIAFIVWSLYEFVKGLPELIFGILNLICIAVTFGILYVVVKFIIKIIEDFRGEK